MTDTAWAELSITASKGLPRGARAGARRSLVEAVRR
jgi:hypothetical protein